jgi:hypothetical protein
MIASRREGETMFNSIPDYRRFAEATIQGVCKDRQRTSPDRLARMLFNVILLAGLWGVPLYARWVILADIDKDIAKPEQAQGTIIGKWRATNGTHFSITFTEDGQFVLSWKEIILETATYWFHQGNQELIVVADFREQPGDHLVEGDDKWWFRASVEAQKLSLSHSFTLHEQFRRKVSWHKHPQRDGEVLKLLPAVFERVE